MKKKLKPEEAFPPEVIELQKKGIPLPTWYSGPLFNLNEKEREKIIEEFLEKRKNIN